MRIVIQSTERPGDFHVPGLVEQIKKECPDVAVSVSVTGSAPTIFSSGIDLIVEVWRHESLLLPVQHFMRILKTHQISSSDRLLVLQDDIAVTPGMFKWLDNEFKWPCNVFDIGCVSLYMDKETQDDIEGNRQWIERVIHPVDVDACNAGACAMYFPPDSIRYIIDNASSSRRKSIGHYLLDIFMLDNRKWIYHNPSLVQHVGKMSTIGLGTNEADCRHAMDIPESMDANVCEKHGLRDPLRCDRQRIGIR